MFTPKLLKYFVTGAASLLILVTVVLGANRLSMLEGDLVLPSNDLEEAVVEEGTEIVIMQRCTVCGKNFFPDSVKTGQWLGKNRDELSVLLASQSNASLILFDNELIVIQFPPGRCPECQWPQRGHIGLVEGNQIAVFGEDGSLVEIYGDAPGDWLDSLEQGIPFESPKECEDLLINLTS